MSLLRWNDDQSLLIGDTLVVTTAAFLAREEEQRKVVVRSFLWELQVWLEKKEQEDPDNWREFETETGKMLWQYALQLPVIAWKATVDLMDEYAWSCKDPGVTLRKPPPIF